MSSKNSDVLDLSRISQLEKDISAALKGEDTERLLDLVAAAKDLAMSSQLLKATTIARQMQKVRKFHDSSVSRAASEVVGNWKKVFMQDNINNSDSQSSTDFSKMSLEDFLMLDLHLPRLRDRQYVEQQSCHPSRVQAIQKSSMTGGRVVYWMSRDQRLCDNWALLRAQEIALEHSLPLAIVFSLTSSYPGANLRHYGFMLRGLKMLQIDAEHHNIPFFILKGSAEHTIADFCRSNDVRTLVADFSPLRISSHWKSEVKSQLDDNVTFLEVDAHNVCPCWSVSKKCEFSAKTIRGKVHGQVDEYLHEYPALRVQPDGTQSGDSGGIKWIANSNEYVGVACGGNKDIWQGAEGGACEGAGGVMQYIKDVDRSVPEVSWVESGERAAMKALKSFLLSESGTVRGSRLERYAEDRNNPCYSEAVSNLSAYLHFGQISSQRICLEVKRTRNFTTNRALFPEGERTSGVHSFCEELVVRKELSDNFCLYNPHYDSIEGAHNWAQTTLREHWDDARAVKYSQQVLENGTTKDDLWNAAQLEMVHRGKMHGFMRMYWAKKILEWTDNPAEGLRIAIYLNDKYSLDGRDPNGYVGCMWAIAGVHDRAWGPVRPVFGKIRFMNYDGCKRKFDIKRYMARQRELIAAVTSASASSSISNGDSKTNGETTRKKVAK